MVSNYGRIYNFKLNRYRKVINFYDFIISHLDINLCEVRIFYKVIKACDSIDFYKVVSIYYFVEKWKL